MKKISIRLLLLLLGVSAGMVSCIHDDTTGFVKKISEITITKVSGEGVDEDKKYAVAEVMVPVRIEAEAEQTLEGYELSYEWKTGFIKEYDREGKPQMDSLGLISESKILEHSFNRVGEFLVRLRVYNEFGSTFYYMTVEVKAGMERGLMVLSSDDAGKGSLTFCSVERGANELLQAKAEDFEPDAWARIKPDYELVGARDMVVMDFGNYKNSVFVLSASRQCMYELDQNSLLVLRKIDLTILQKDIKPVALVPCRMNMAVMTEAGQVVCSELGQFGLLDDRWGTKMKGIKLYQGVTMLDGGPISIPIVADNENERVEVYGNINKTPVNSGSDFQGRRIVNFALVGFPDSRSLLVVSEPKNNPDKVWITIYQPMFNVDYYDEMFKKESGYQENEYSLSAPLTLDMQSDMVYNRQYNVMFYNSGNTVYRWRYTSGFSDSHQTSLPGNGEITCMAESPDGEYLYVGAYDAAAAGLKGSVYIYTTKDLQLVKSFIGITDKPLKLFYKDKN